MRIALVGPVLVVALLYAVVIGGRLQAYDGNVTGFVVFGQQFAPYTHPPRGALISSPIGYDGQFFYSQAEDPLLLRDRTSDSFRTVRPPEAFRLQRVAYPTVAYLLAGGERSAIPWSLLVINVLVVLAITGAVAAYARRRGWSGWWAVCVGLLAGFLTGTLRDLSDPLAVSSMLAGLLMWQRGRRWGAATLLAVAGLTREPMMLAVAAIAVDAAVRCWHTRHEPGAMRRVARDAWPPVIVPAIAFVAWHAYVYVRLGGNPASMTQAFLPLFKGLIDEARHALGDGSPSNTVWDLAYIALMATGIAAAIALVWRKVTVAGVAALLFGSSLLVLPFGDPWSYTRLSAPMFAALLLAGLEQRDRPALLVCAAGVAMTAIMPLAPWLGVA